jgi:purine-nucleoside phosphorylase
MLNRIRESVAFIRDKTDFLPEAGIVLGSGLGGLVNELNVEHTLSYSDIPNFPVSTVEGHGSNLLFGTLNDVRVVVMQGRFHFYEGYSMQEVAFPIRVMGLLGIKRLFLSNASGGMNPEFEVGDLMIIDDHINLMGTNPLIGKNINELGPRFPDMSAPYDPGLIKKALAIAGELGVDCKTGIYAAVTGPTYETRAEYKYIRTVGADCVGMSTVPEVIAARHMNLPVFAISIITDMGGQEEVQVITHEEVLRVAKKAEEKMTSILRQLVAS